MTTRPDVTDPTFLTVAEAAALLRVNERTIFNRVRSGHIPAKRLAGGRHVLIDRQQLLGLLEDIPTVPKAQPAPEKTRATQEA